MTIASKLQLMMKGGKVAKFDEMHKFIGSGSSIRIRKYLTELGVLSSLNCNNRYYILPEECEFDNLGFYRQNRVVFHRENTLLPTIKALVDASEAGLKSCELSELMGTDVRTKMAQAIREDLLSRESIPNSRAFRFFSYKIDLKERQLKAREALSQAELMQQQQAAQQAENEATERPPKGVLESEIIELLLLILKRPNANEKSLALSLQSQGFKLNLSKVKQIFKAYSLEPKKN